MKQRLKFEVTDIDALEAAHPDCVVTKKVVDHSKLYAKVKAAKVLGQDIPGVEIDMPAFLQKKAS